jgi:hypothetical protein
LPQPVLLGLVQEPQEPVLLVELLLALQPQVLLPEPLLVQGLPLVELPVLVALL